ASRRWLPIDRPAPGRSLDPAGLVTLSAAVLALVVPLVLGHDAGWPPWTFVALAAAALGIAVFAWIERRVEHAGGSPLITERVLRAAGFSPALVAILLATASTGGFLFSFTQHL